MSWLEDLEYDFKFECENLHQNTVRAKAKEGRPEPPACSECGEALQYRGFKPQQIKQTHNVEFEQNGRKAVRTRGKNGEIQHVSKTKLNYMKTGRVESQYTKDYKEHIEKENEKAVKAAMEKEKKEEARRRNMDGHIKSMIKSLPDGEYLSDGVRAEPLKK